MDPPPPPAPSPAVRVLSRTPPPQPTSSPSPPPPAAAAAAAAAAAPTSSHDGVVAVGFFGGGGTARLADRILDAHVFSPGGSGRTLAGGVRYHRDGERRMVFLHLAPSPATATLDAPGDLRGLLFMFSVCHVIIFIQEGFRFDTQILKRFRLLQSSKHAFAPFVRSLVSPAMPSKAARSNTPTKPTHRASSISPPACRGGRHPSAISLMSGTGSHPSMLPGLCVPVVLFVFEDDPMDGPGAATSLDDTSDTSSSNQASNTDSLPKPNMTSKGSSSVVMLARPAIRSDSTFSKKIHSSVEGQIRFLLKKCRTLVGSEPGHIVSRGVSNVSHLPLFSLDTSRAVALLDRSINKKREALDIIAGLFEDSLTSKSSLDISSLENNCHSATHEDVQFIKDFIFRQSDGLRGRGGHSSNTTSAPVSGVGMVAAAAAAAAASAASGKQTTAPDLPSFDTWLSISSSISSALISMEDGSSSSQSKKAPPAQKNDQLPSAGSNSIRTALSCLESNNGLNVKFSTSWCQRVLPVAKEVYLKDLPAFYPTSMHQVQLQKALQSFHSMVKGPAVQEFSKKLKDECQAIWESGRQQCDAISLTGRPCKHQRHSKSSSSDGMEQHSSGYIFLHACACGRSRRLRDDPFDFVAANVTFNCFSNCEDLLPTLVLPRGTNAGSFSVSSWRLVRLGGAKYYKPTKGLLQAGFCSKEKYLLRWTISLGKEQGKHVTRDTTKLSSASNADPQAPVVAGEVKSTVTQVTAEIKSMKLENSRKQPEVESMNNSSINFGKGLPNFTMKKPFAEVVAGHPSKDSEFPALQLKKPLKPGNRKDDRLVSVADQTNGRSYAALSQGPIADNESEKVSRDKSNGSADGKPFLQIGSNIVPMVVGKETKEINQPVQQFVVYVGFEHECSYGHRFLLSEKHLKEIGSSVLPFEKSNLNNEAESKHGSQKLPQNASRFAATMDLTSGGKHNRPMDSSGRNTQQQLLQPRVDSEIFQHAHSLSDPQNESKGDLSLQYVTLDDDGEAFSLLNRNLPIYMHCPHCKSSDWKGNQDVKFAAAVSQLQRIFIVTPDFPVLLASCPVVQFEASKIIATHASCMPSNASDHEQQGLFSLGCRVVLPPESFLTMRLPFVYGVETRDGNTTPLKYLDQQPELTAWLVGGTALQIVSAGHATEKEAPL
uniref:Nonsense-mediated mRNA decay factor SMG8 n=1 Tax=Leersia perrieri TaxID=77586 RepID=A0A0D9VMW0_9ORYZ